MGNSGSHPTAPEEEGGRDPPGSSGKASGAGTGPTDTDLSPSFWTRVGSFRAVTPTRGAEGLKADINFPTYEP